MSFVTALPEALTTAAGGLGSIGATVTASNAAVAAPTIIDQSPAATDPVSALLGVFFQAHGLNYQAIAAEASVIHELFVSTMGVSSGSYAATEVANTVAAL